MQMQGRQIGHFLSFDCTHSIISRDYVTELLQSPYITAECLRNVVQTFRIYIQLTLNVLRLILRNVGYVFADSQKKMRKHSTFRIFFVSHSFSTHCICGVIRCHSANIPLFSCHDKVLLFKSYSLRTRVVFVMILIVFVTNLSRVRMSF